MPTVNGKKFPYDAAGKRAAEAARAQGLPDGPRPGAKPGKGSQPKPRTLPKQASSTARNRAFGQRGAAMRKRR